MFNKINWLLMQKLWDSYIVSIPKFYSIFNSNKACLDHLAIIDLPSDNSGINYLHQVFNKLGFIKLGHGYLPQKANDFIWLNVEYASDTAADKVLPMVILADFRYDSLSKHSRQILTKYSSYSKALDFSRLDLKIAEYLSNSKLSRSQDDLASAIVAMVYEHIISRQWPLPTVKEFLTVKEENELIAWVLAFGRRVNHFGININLLNEYPNLDGFNKYLKDKYHVELNNIGGEIKGDIESGLAQSATVGQLIKVQLQDGEIEINDSFIEFVWRYAIKDNPKYFSDYYTGFVPANANNIIESCISA